MATAEALLLETYPLTLVAPRHPFTSLDGRRMWYVVRDGAILPAVDSAFLPVRNALPTSAVCLTS